MNEEKNESGKGFRRFDIKSTSYSPYIRTLEIEMRDGKIVTIDGAKLHIEPIATALRDLWDAGEIIELKTSEPETPDWAKPVETYGIDVLTDRISALARRVCELENLGDSELFSWCGKKIRLESSKNDTTETIKHVFDGELA